MPESATYDMLRTDAFDDLMTRPYVALTGSALAGWAGDIRRDMVAFLVRHPDATLDGVLSYLVNDEFHAVMPLRSLGNSLHGIYDAALTDARAARRAAGL